MLEAGPASEIDRHQNACEVDDDGIGSLCTDRTCLEGSVEIAQSVVEVADGLLCGFEIEGVSSPLLIGVNRLGYLQWRSRPVDRQALRIGNAEHCPTVPFDVAQ